MSDPTAFFCRAKPQGSDAWPIFKDAPGVFIGYPIAKEGAEYDPENLSSCLISPACDDGEWAHVWDTVRPWRRDYTKNRNFIRQIEIGSIVVVPRPSLGAVFLSKVKTEFQIIDNPPWREKYLALRREQRLNDDDEGYWHTADVAQGWLVEPYKQVALSAVPGWIRRSLFGRSTYGALGAHPLTGASAHSVLEPLYEGRPTAAPAWTLDLDQVKLRLIDQVTASSFEHLVVSLLQLENPDLRWMHTGGAGDGGVDGLAANDHGETVGLLQCKLYADYAPDFALDGPALTSMKTYSAVLLPEKPGAPQTSELLDLDWVTQAILRHWQLLPQARSMRIGKP